jgi:hypothetical protein
MVEVKTELIGIEPIQDLIELALWTPYVKYERTVSLMIIAKPESGKTEILKKYCRNHGVISMRRFSAFGIQEGLKQGTLKPLFNHPKILGHLLIYDFAQLFSFKMNTIDSTMAFLDSLTEEGLEPEATYAIQPDVLKKFKGLKGGIIAAINTRGFFTPRGKKRIRANLLKGGFFSRNILASYDMGHSVFNKAMDGLIHGDYRENQNFVKLIHLDFPKKRIDIELSVNRAEELAEITVEILDEIKTDLDADFRGIRLGKSLISLAKASALRDGRKEVSNKDIERIRFLANWMNGRMNKLKTKYGFYEGLN